MGRAFKGHLRLAVRTARAVGYRDGVQGMPSYGGRGPRGQAGLQTSSIRSHAAARSTLTRTSSTDATAPDEILRETDEKPLSGNEGASPDRDSTVARDGQLAVRRIRRPDELVQASAWTLDQVGSDRNLECNVLFCSPPHPVVHAGEGGMQDIGYGRRERRR
jgi:hypothetical protein